MLEAMQERVVTVGGERHLLPSPFFVLATQNPIEQEGTYPLPEAQLDRFMFNIPLTYPTYEQEVEIVKQTTITRDVTLKHVLNTAQISEYQQLIRKIPVSDNVLEYAVNLVAKTRPGTPSATKEANNYLGWEQVRVPVSTGPWCEMFCSFCAENIHRILKTYRLIANLVLRHRIVRTTRLKLRALPKKTSLKHCFNVAAKASVCFF
ncbi:MAG: AAA family ATPase [Saprospiraceae bacterium]